MAKDDDYVLLAPEDDLELLPIESKKKEPESSISGTESALRAAGQGATLKFGDEASAALESGVIAPVANALGLGPDVSYEQALATNRAQNTAADEANPMISGAAGFAGGLPAAVATGGSSLAANTAISGGLGALEAAGASDNDKLSAAVEGGIKGAATAGLVGGGLKLLGKVTSSILKGTKGAYGFGKETGKLLNNEEVQREITREFNAVPDKALAAVQKASSSVGAAQDELVSKYADIPVDVKKTFSPVYKSLDNLYVKNNDQLGKDVVALKDIVKSYENALADPRTGGATLKAANDAKKELGQLIYEQKIFKDSKSVDKIAKSFYSDLKNSVAKADIEQGSGGRLAKINDAYGTLQQMKGEAPTGASLMSYLNPQGASATDKVEGFIEPFSKLPDDIRKAYAPELEAIIKKDIPSVLVKGNLMKKVTGRDPSTFFGINQIGGVSSSVAGQGANLLGKVAGQEIGGSSLESLGQAGLNRLGGTIGSSGQE